MRRVFNHYLGYVARIRVIFVYSKGHNDKTKIHITVVKSISLNGKESKKKNGNENLIYLPRS